MFHSKSNKKRHQGEYFAQIGHFCTKVLFNARRASENHASKII